MVEKRRDKVTFRGRAQRRAIQQLYESDAVGILEEELVDEIGIGFLFISPVCLARSIYFR